ncbi:hypothetical protein BDQ17DRAFT_1430100 [Cyathus striatus]|nr:hypothetical protein BDQ17DRAFT_1430100 [Cyathus striatus]
MTSLTGSPSIRIPQETVDLIIDELVASLDDENYHSLKICALICEEFLIASRRYHFHTIKLEFQDYQKEQAQRKYEGLKTALISSPGIVQYIRRLTICDVSSDPRLLILPNLPEVLGMLKHITELSITLDDYGNWDELCTLHLNLALGNMISSPTLQQLTLFGIANFPLEWIGCVPDVRLYFVTFKPIQDRLSAAQLTERTPGRALKSLSLFQNPHSFKHAQPLIDHLAHPTCTLETLKVGLWNDIKPAMVIAGRHASSITTLEFPPYGLINRIWFQMLFIIRLPPRLQTIRVCIDFRSELRLLIAIDILSKAKDDNNIQEVIIVILGSSRHSFVSENLSLTEAGFHDNKINKWRISTSDLGYS